MGSRSIGGSRVKKHAVSSDTKETTLRGQRPSSTHSSWLKGFFNWSSYQLKMESLLADWFLAFFLLVLRRL
jgi:hypothetical protein